MHFARLSIGLLVIATLSTSLSCKDEVPAKSSAYRVASRTQLIGGPTALGEIGDFKLENDKIRIVIQDKTYNRGSGIFGGSLIDADLQRFDTRGTSLGGTGNDSFGELFPVYFLEMIDPQEIDVVNDGSSGAAAVVEVSGRGGEFITMLRYLNQIMVNSYSVSYTDILGGEPPTSDGEPLVEFKSRYILEPGASHVRIESSLTNISFEALEFPSTVILGVLKSFLGLDLNNMRIPTGHVLGFGAKSHIFIPGVGYDLRFGLDEAYSNPIPLPGFPGLLTQVVASSSDLGVSYGFATVAEPESNFTFQRDKENLYDGQAREDDMLFLFYASGFGGVFTHETPSKLAPIFCESGTPDSVCGVMEEDQERDCRRSWDDCVSAHDEGLTSGFTYTNYFIVGDGDVASIFEELYRIRGLKLPTLQGRVFDEVTREPVGIRHNVLFYTVGNSDCSTATIFNQVHTNGSGHFSLKLPPGDYCYRTQYKGHPLGHFTYVKVGKTGAPFINALERSSGTVIAQVYAESGHPAPAKLSLVGIHELNQGVETRSFLFDLQTGESWRASDMVPDTDDPQTRRYLEDTAFGGANGTIRLQAPPGKYTAVISRGPEYETVSKEVELRAGKIESFNATLKRTVDTTGYLSGDFHLHAAGSIDSGLDLSRRIKSSVAEGLEVAVATDHNYVTDYRPIIFNENLQDWMTSVVGLELTTFEAGHFNAFPVVRELDSMSRGSVKWQDVPPQKIFDALRALGPEDGNIVQVNHPRTPILGYFYQHNVDPFVGEVDLGINTAPASDRLIATLTTPSGPAFIETIRDENGDPQEYKTTFSWDFDAIEVFNGKHFEELRHFRMPYDKNSADFPSNVLEGFKANYAAAYDTPAEFHAVVFPESTPEEIEMLSDAEIEAGVDAWVMVQIPEQHTILCDGDDVVFGGGIDDWYNFLNYPRPDGLYRPYTGTGNSDSHKDYLDEVGYPRNYFFVGHDDPKKFKNAELVKAIQTHRNIITNGPFVDFTINGAVMGSQVEAAGKAKVDIHIAAADWVGADRFRLIMNGEAVLGLSDGQEPKLGWVDIELVDGVYEGSYEVDVAKDSWFLIEVEGDQNLFPVLTPQEIPPFNFDAVIGSLAGAFGFGGGVEGLEPAETFIQTPFALTNPIWVIVDGDGKFDPPSPPKFSCQGGAYLPVAAGLSSTEVIRSNTPRLKAQSIPTGIKHNNPFKRKKGEPVRDLRMMFESFGHMH